ncbi:MGH1-like glycoside hydrolase domain-containing protein [Lutibaculum baratangense]|nr:trehalase family glycosidase [Lutibaculum baratangense]
MVFLPLGVRVTPVLYSTRAKAATTIRPADCRFGRHAIDGSLVELETVHGGTRIALAYGKAIDPYAVAGRWEGVELGEWGLRFWVTICLSADGGEAVEYLADARAAVVKIGTRFVALVSADEPVQVTVHEDVEALAADFEANGYFHLASRGTTGRLVALRFNLEMMREGRFAAGVADRADLAIARAREALDEDEAPALPAQVGANAGSLDAVRDVMAWNTVWDPVNRRPYTACSRIWNLGEFAVWQNDQTYHAMMSALFDRALARDNFAAAMASATPQGNFACIVTSHDSWVDRTQAPNGAFMVWLAYLRTRDRSLLDLTYRALARNHRWWREMRDPDGRGLVSCGTSDVGEALYKGTAFGARNETGMDNSATHDEAVYDPGTRTLSTLDVGLNCSLALDAEMLSLAAAEIGEDEEADRFAALAEDTKRKIREELWDEERGLFANRQRDGSFVRSVGPTSLYPLICGAASRAQADRLVAHLDDPAMFGGPFGLPNATRNDPAYRDNVYWRGRIWPNVNWFVWQGLRRYRLDEAAEGLLETSLQLFEQSWRERRIAAENYNAETGEAMDQPDTDPFYGWAAMLPLMGAEAVMGFSPWDGWSIGNDGDDVRLGPVESPLGRVVVEVEAGWLTLWKGEKAIFTTDVAGTLSQLTVGANSFSFRLEEGTDGAVLVLPDRSEAELLAALLGGADIEAADGERGLELTLPPTDGPTDLFVAFAPAD